MLNFDANIDFDADYKGIFALCNVVVIHNKSKTNYFLSLEELQSTFLSFDIFIKLEDMARTR